MGKEVRISRRAARDLEKITDYLFKNWNANVVADFISRYEECLDLLTKNPEQYPIARKNTNVRRCVLTKHNVAYFREFPHKITILTIFDTRQNPEKLDKII